MRTPIVLLSLMASLTLASPELHAGGTGRTSLPSGNMLLGAGGGAIGLLAPGTSGDVATSNGSTWVSQAPHVNTYSLMGATGTFTTPGSWTTIGSVTISVGRTDAIVNIWTDIDYDQPAIGCGGGCFSCGTVMGHGPGVDATTASRFTEQGVLTLFTPSVDSFQSASVHYSTTGLSVGSHTVNLSVEEVAGAACTINVVGNMIVEVLN